MAFFTVRAKQAQRNRCSAFQKNDPMPRKDWIEPLQSAHLTRVVMLELEANG
jgi:hypothetical protein